jgi:hypothetical protein
MAIESKPVRLLHYDIELALRGCYLAVMVRDLRAYGRNAQPGQYGRMLGYARLVCPAQPRHLESPPSIRSTFFGCCKELSIQSSSRMAFCSSCHAILKVFLLLATGLFVLQCCSAPICEPALQMWPSFPFFTAAVARHLIKVHDAYDQLPQGPK